MGAHASEKNVSALDEACDGGLGSSSSSLMLKGGARDTACEKGDITNVLGAAGPLMGTEMLEEAAKMPTEDTFSEPASEKRVGENRASDTITSKGCDGMGIENFAGERNDDDKGATATVGLDIDPRDVLAEAVDSGPGNTSSSYKLKGGARVTACEKGDTCKVVGAASPLKGIEMTVEVGTRASNLHTAVTAVSTGSAGLTTAASNCMTFLGRRWRAFAAHHVLDLHVLLDSCFVPPSTLLIGSPPYVSFTEGLEIHDAIRRFQASQRIHETLNQIKDEQGSLRDIAVMTATLVLQRRVTEVEPMLLTELLHKINAEHAKQPNPALLQCINLLKLIYTSQPSIRELAERPSAKGRRRGVR